MRNKQGSSVASALTLVMLCCSGEKSAKNYVRSCLSFLFHQLLILMENGYVLKNRNQKLLRYWGVCFLCDSSNLPAHETSGEFKKFLIPGPSPDQLNPNLLGGSNACLRLDSHCGMGREGERVNSQVTYQLQLGRKNIPVKKQYFYLSQKYKMGLAGLNSRCWQDWVSFWKL